MICTFTEVAKWNLFHCLSCWDAPSLGPTLVFSQSKNLLSHLLDLKEKKKEGRRDIKGKKVGVKQERRKERKKVLEEKYN